jgi:hypothetical protein
MAVSGGVSIAGCLPVMAGDCDDPDVGVEAVDEVSVIEENCDVVVPTWHIRASRNNFRNRVARPQTVMVSVRV